MDVDERYEHMATNKDDWNKKMIMRKTASSNKRPLASSEEGAGRDKDAVDRIMTITEAHPDQPAVM